MESPSDTQTLAIVPTKYLKVFHEGLVDRSESFDTQNIYLFIYLFIYLLQSHVLSIRTINLILKKKKKKDTQNMDPTKRNRIFAFAYAFLLEYENDFKDHNLVTKDQFMAAATREPQFLEILRKAAKSPLDHEALETLIYHSMCFTLRWIRP